ncbi:MAG TPA: hypothetical protein VL240_07440 [Candidatus Binatia bacterium]|nr:hypothetical protein [Candidatus Binatia bacterium]
MKRIFFLAGAGLLAATMVFAQDMPRSTANSAQDEKAPSRTQIYQTQSSVVRGCLSGSAGNYTLTDQNGMQYSLVGDDAALGSHVGHEVEVTTRQSEASDSRSGADQSTTRTTNTLQISDVRDLSAGCNAGSSAGTPPPAENNSMNPKGTPETTEAPKPQMMAMLQQESRPDAGTQTNSASQTQANPPVSSQTPAASTPPTGPTSQVGNSPANNTGMTESEANHDAQAARQGELNTNPQNGQTTGRGVNNQGVNNPATTNPNAVPTSPNSVTQPSNPPPGNANDQNKPLYERQATDIPWANGSGGNTGTPPPPH